MSELFLNFHKNDQGNADKPRQLFIFGDTGEVVTVKNGNGFNQTVTLNSDGFAIVEIPVSEEMSGTEVNNLGFQITSENQIQAYFSNRSSASTDLTIIFEKSSLGTEYVLSSFGDNIGEGGQFSVQATEDNTTVNVTLTNGETFSQTINAGETFKFATGGSNSGLGISVPLGFDLTGTLIQTTAPAAVFSGHSCTDIGSGACDHIVEQMPPVDALSNSYIVGEAFKNGSGNNLVRVVAAKDSTQVTVDGSVVATLNAGESYDFTLSNDAAQITTSEPALVAQYLQGRNTAGGEGDPAMMFVPGQDAWLQRYKLATPAGDARFEDNLVNVVIPTTALSSLKLNGDAVDTNGFVQVGSSGFSVGNLEIAPGLFTMEASEPFQVSLFGYDYFDSYLTFGAATFASGISNEFPILAINNGLTVDEDAVGNITTTQLQVTDADNTAAEITYTVTDPTDNGDLLLDGNTLAVNDTFTQADIDNNRLTYDHDGSETTSDSFDFTVNDGAGGSIDSQTFNFTVNPLNDGEIRGTKWNDLNGDGVFTTDEPGLAGVTIYLDTNNNGVLDSGEPNTVTLDDNPTTSDVNETGQYTFTNLAAGTYIVREETPQGFEQTFPLGSETAVGDGFADVVLDYFNSGTGTFDEPYGADNDGNFPVLVNTDIILGSDELGALSLPTGSFVTVGFNDEIIIDRPGNDIFIPEVGAEGEQAEVFVSSDGETFVSLGIGNGGQTSEFDLASINFTDPVRAIKIVGLDNGGGSPGFDVINVQGLSESLASPDFHTVDLGEDETVENIDFGNAFTDIPNEPENKGRSKGEPHLTTFDGVGYSFQGAGEFTLAKSDDLNVQIRYVELGSKVSVASAVATEIEGRRVVIDSKGVDFQDGRFIVTRSGTDTEPTITIDDQVISLDDNSEVDIGNSRLYRRGSQYTIVFAGEDGIINDGDDQLALNYYRSGIINIVDVCLDDDSKGKVQGLLGNLNDDPNDDIRLPDGTVFTERPLKFTDVYGDFREAWRV